MNRDQLIEWLEENLLVDEGRSHKSFGTTEEFYGYPEDKSEGNFGVWISAEDGCTYKGESAYEYWTRYENAPDYTFGVLNKFEAKLKRSKIIIISPTARPKLNIIANIYVWEI